MSSEFSSTISAYSGCEFHLIDQDGNSFVPMSFSWQTSRDRNEDLCVITAMMTDRTSIDSFLNVIELEAYFINEFGNRQNLFKKKVSRNASYTSFGIDDRFINFTLTYYLV